MVRLRITPQIIAGAVPWREARIFISAAGRLSRNQLLSAVPEMDPMRYFSNDDEVFHVDDKTYALTNQWGTDTEDAVKGILAVLPQNHGIVYQVMN